MAYLSVVVDGVALPEADARAFWERFSAYMDAHRGDLAGFARVEGFASVRPVVGEDGPELVVSRSASQVPYRNAEKVRSNAGSAKPQARAPKPHRNKPKQPKS